MKSMTGFGAAEYTDSSIQISLEIKTVNHRYKDIFVKLPRKYSALEDQIRKHVSGALNRGRIEVFLNIRSFADSSPDITYNKAAAEKYIQLLSELKEDFPGLADDMSLIKISQFQDVFISDEKSPDTEELWKLLLPVLDRALQAAEEARADEGAKLLTDLQSRISNLKDSIRKIEEHAPQLPGLYYQQLEKHLKSFSESIIDEQRLTAEMLLYADRINITEEIVRIKLHFDNLSKQLELDVPVGRKIDFILQEINREANTIASKSSNFDISIYAVDIKSELEKIREQIQNIE